MAAQVNVEAVVREIQRERGERKMRLGDLVEYPNFIRAVSVVAVLIFWEIGARNIDQVYAFLDFCYEAEPAGKAIDKHGYNSAVLGADKFAGETYKKNFSEAYPGQALGNLWPWPKEPQWYANVRTEYRNKFVNA